MTFLEPDAPARADKRHGFTMLEFVIAFSVLATAMLLVAQLVTWTLAERSRALLQQEAVEAAVNVLEVARATPWDRLDADWAKAQKAPDSLAERLNAPQWSVRVSNEADRPLTKRVTVEIEGKNIGPVHMTALFSARSTVLKGDRR
jgi:Tfp pilus assembly protein PilV